MEKSVRYDDDVFTQCKQRVHYKHDTQAKKRQCIPQVHTDKNKLKNN